MKEDSVLEHIDFNISREITSDHFLNCTFQKCNFSGYNLSHFVFEDCSFIECDLSNAKLGDTSFKVVKFKNCKLIGLQFSDCRPMLLEMHFERCTVDYSLFYGLNLKHSSFEACSLKESDFSNADLEKVNFKNCDLDRATFHQTNLRSCNFLTAANFIIDPESNTITKAKFSRTDLAGLLTKYSIIISS